MANSNNIDIENSHNQNKEKQNNHQSDILVNQDDHIVGELSIDQDENTALNELDQEIRPEYLSFRSNRRSMILSVTCLLLCLFFNLVTLAIIHERVPRHQPPLPDVSFEILPKNNEALNLAEYIILILSSGVLIMILCHRYRWIIFSRLCLILSMLYLFRGICMAVTQVPIANLQYYCSPQLDSNEKQGWQFVKTIVWRVFHMSVGLGLSVGGRHTFCGDYIFSGHTLILVTADLFLVHYWLETSKTLALRLLKYLCHFLVLVGVSSILIARGHYLVDIVLALIISYLTFAFYHILCQLKISNQWPSRNCWWFIVFQFFEHNSIKNHILIENRFEFPWSICIKHKKSSRKRLDSILIK